MTNLTDIRNYLRKQPDIMLVYLYGSLHGKTAMPDSDYDLIIVTPTPLMPQRRSHIEQQLATMIKSPLVVLVALDHNPNQRSYAIVTEGASLFTRDLAHHITIEKQALTIYTPPPTPSPPPAPPEQPTPSIPIPQTLYT